MPSASVNEAARADGSAGDADGLRSSDRLKAIAAGLDGAVGMSLGDFAHSLGRSAYGLLVLIFALACTVPGPPGMGAVFGTPLVLLGIGMVRRKRHPTFPAPIARVVLPAAGLRLVLDKSVPILVWLERWLRPRNLLGGAIDAARADRAAATLEMIAGIAVTLLAILLLPPIPFTNAPLGAAAVCLALGLMERDGIAILVGLALTAVASAFTFMLAGGIVSAILAGVRALMP